ncbi:hypothetical protein LCGC14_0462550 [marine sediment metagenome]|uniref:Uncharacterized protein n=1 Tax=marine sediment metagenome TaxID=412755 RepID=A0A0F9V1M3_9ZZZZ
MREIKEILKTQKQRWERRRDELELRGGKSIRDCVKETNQNIK